MAAADKKKPLEITDVRITGIQVSGDGENFEDANNLSHFGSFADGLTHIVNLLKDGERVIVRTKYVDIYNNGTSGLPKTGGTYELRLLEIQPMRQIIPGEVVKELPPAPAAPAQTQGGEK